MPIASPSIAQQRSAIAEVLVCLRAELQRLDLWEAAPPPAQRLASDQPFCWDTLTFHQWLQWRFLPRMAAALAGQEAWPEGSAIHPYAEECLASRMEDFHELLFLIQTLDELICGAVPADAGYGDQH